MANNLITDDIKALIGKDSPPETNRFAISDEMAFDVADAIEDFNPLYIDPKYAANSRFGTLLCPPLATWKDIGPPIGYFGAGQEWHFEVPLPFNSYGLNGGSDWQFLRPCPVGTWITRRFRMLDIFEKQGRSGPLVFIVREETQTDQSGNIINKAKRVSIHRALPEGDTPDTVALANDTLQDVIVAPPNPEVILPKPEHTKTSQRYFEDVSVGDKLEEVIKGPMTTTHLIRWAAANGNYARIHWDLPFAQLHQGLKNVVVNGSLKNQYLGQLLIKFAGEEGWFKRFYVEHRGMDFPGDTITAAGTVTKTYESEGYGHVECQVSLTNNRGETTASGTGKVVLPKKGQSLPIEWAVEDW